MIFDPYDPSKSPRDGGVWRRPTATPPRPKTVLKYCLDPNCSLMSAGHLNYWLPCDVEHAEQRGYDTMMAFCPAHQKLPTDKLVSA